MSNDKREWWLAVMDKSDTISFYTGVMMRELSKTQLKQESWIRIGPAPSFCSTDCILSWIEGRSCDMLKIIKEKSSW